MSATNRASLYHTLPDAEPDEPVYYDEAEPVCRACQNSGYVPEVSGQWVSCQDCQPQEVENE